MAVTKSYAAPAASAPLEPWEFQRRETGVNDVQIDILFCGVCHSDLHQVRNEWGVAFYPLVPGHEIVGTVSKTGTGVTKFKEGDMVGVGCFVDSCRVCDNCKEGKEQYCSNGHSQTYASYEQDKVTPTYGGYSKSITVTQEFVLHVSDKLAPDAVAPLLCAGITT